MFFLIVLLVLGAGALLSLAIIPMLQDRIKAWQEKKEKTVSKQLDSLFYDKNPRNIIRLYFVLPPAFAFIALVFLHHIAFAIAGAALGLFIPNFILKARDKQRRAKFNHQILDMIMVLSSSLKGGLSLLQALEVVNEEMPPPISQEIGWVVREAKMGLTLEESLNRLVKRMNLDDLNLVINAILVARETGGDLTKVFSRLSTTIRDNRKLQDNIRTLTLQGRMQGIIMSLLPFMFIWWVLTFNKGHFDIMMQSEIGRVMLFAAAFLQVVGMILIKKFSTIKI